MTDFKISKMLFLIGLIFLGGGPVSVFAAKASTHTIAIENITFTPANESVEVGDIVIWVNKDLVPHTVTAEDGSFDSKTIEVGKIWKFQVRKKGVVAYKCQFHPNMHARLTAK